MGMGGSHAPTGALILVWVYLENGGDPEVMQGFTKGRIRKNCILSQRRKDAKKKTFSYKLVHFAVFASWREILTFYESIIICDSQ